MPVGGRVTMTAFDGSKKGNWLFADIHGLIYTWGAMVAVGLLLVVLIYSMTGIMLLDPFAYATDLIKERWGSDWAVLALIATTLIPPFVLVFVFRRNFTVRPQRQFRYICRWF